jgi:hypothetical protein
VVSSTSASLRGIGGKRRSSCHSPIFRATATNTADIAARGTKAGNPRENQHDGQQGERVDHAGQRRAPPLLTLAEVRAMAPVTGRPPKNGQTRLAMPWATSSVLLSWRSLEARRQPRRRAAIRSRRAGRWRWPGRSTRAPVPSPAAARPGGQAGGNGASGPNFDPIVASPSESCQPPSDTARWPRHRNDRARQAPRSRSRGHSRIKAKQAAARAKAAGLTAEVPQPVQPLEKLAGAAWRVDAQEIRGLRRHDRHGDAGGEAAGDRPGDELDQRAHAARPMSTGSRRPSSWPPPSRHSRVSRRLIGPWG